MNIKISKILIIILALSVSVFLGGCNKRDCPKKSDNRPWTSDFREDCPYFPATDGLFR